MVPSSNMSLKLAAMHGFKFTTEGVGVGVVGRAGRGGGHHFVFSDFTSTVE